MTLKVGEGPFLQALYQQMVHEYGSSRYLFYQALQNKRDSHFCMSDIFYVDTSDSPQHGYWIDMIKASFKIIYGIFDKIGTFISKYYTVESKAVYFKTIWYKKQKKENGLLDIFTAAENHVFRGLYWLSKDLMGDLDETNGSEFCVEPAARKIALLRNRMEHGYVRVIDENNHPSSLDSDFAMVITLDELVNKTYDLFSLVREALMCLAMAVNGEEINKTNSTDGHVFSIGLPISKNM
nr:LA2681 family HEPN domain-containing protein [Desulfolutivibrio sulfodismutans]